MTKKELGFDADVSAEFDVIFGHHEAGEYVEQMKKVRSAIRLAATVIFKNVPVEAKRERARALEQLEYASFLAVAAIARQVPSLETKKQEEYNAAKKESDLEIIAAACHEALKGYFESVGDTSHLPWDDLHESQREGARSLVKLYLLDPCVTAEQFFKVHCLPELGPLSDYDKKKDEIFRTVILDIIHR